MHIWRFDIIASSFICFSFFQGGGAALEAPKNAFFKFFISKTSQKYIPKVLGRNSSPSDAMRSQGGSTITFPAKSEIQRVFLVLPDETKISKTNHSEGVENIDFTY